MIILGLGIPFAIYIRAPNPWSIDLKKLIVIQVVKKFTAFYETKRFITVFTLPLILMLKFMSTTPYPPCKDHDYFKLGDDHFQIISSSLFTDHSFIQWYII